MDRVKEFRRTVRRAIDEAASDLVDLFESELDEFEAHVECREFDRMAEAVREERARWIAALTPLWDACDGRMSPEEAIRELARSSGYTAARLAELAATGRSWTDSLWGEEVR